MTEHPPLSQSIIYCVLFSLPNNGLLERSSIECRKTKTKLIAAAITYIHTYNHKKHWQSSEPIKTRSKYKKLARSLGKGTRASHGWLWLASHWLKMWRDFFKPIAKRSNVKSIQMRIIFDTRLKTSLYVFWFWFWFLS